METAKRIQLLAMDVDGVLTDGGIMLGSNGEELKVFNVRDGMGLSLIRQAGIRTAILTGRSSEPVRRRAEELHITYCMQGLSDKKSALISLMEKESLDPEEVAYIGDDLNDLGPMTAVGLSIAVGDAAPEVGAAAAYRCRAAGGKGAVREAVELILKAQERWDDLVDGMKDGKKAARQ
ncbi:MAG TPA: HAD-IIIA family hydrolase [Bacillota bacterium]|nr:HAD-IIIA family hydrolase [Bacillota bacterium]